MAGWMLTLHWCVCRNLIQMDAFSASDPLVVLFEKDAKSGEFNQMLGQTEWAK